VDNKRFCLRILLWLTVHLFLYLLILQTDAWSWEHETKSGYEPGYQSAVRSHEKWRQNSASIKPNLMGQMDFWRFSCEANYYIHGKWNVILQIWQLFKAVVLIHCWIWRSGRRVKIHHNCPCKNYLPSPPPKSFNVITWNVHSDMLITMNITDSPRLTPTNLSDSYD
jgi:hypothetical protein